MSISISQIYIYNCFLNNFPEPIAKAKAVAKVDHSLNGKIAYKVNDEITVYARLDKYSEVVNNNNNQRGLMSNSHMQELKVIIKSPQIKVPIEQPLVESTKAATETVADVGNSMPPAVQQAQEPVAIKKTAYITTDDDEQPAVKIELIAPFANLPSSADETNPSETNQTDFNSTASAASADNSSYTEKPQSNELPIVVNPNISQNVVANDSQPASTTKQPESNSSPTPSTSSAAPHPPAQQPIIPTTDQLSATKQPESNSTPPPSTSSPAPLPTRNDLPIVANPNNSQPSKITAPATNNQPEPNSIPPVTQPPPAVKVADEKVKIDSLNVADNVIISNDSQPTSPTKQTESNSTPPPSIVSSTAPPPAQQPILDEVKISNPTTQEFSTTKQMEPMNSSPPPSIVTSPPSPAPPPPPPIVKEEDKITNTNDSLPVNTTADQIASIKENPESISTSPPKVEGNINDLPADSKVPANILNENVTDDDGLQKNPINTEAANEENATTLPPAYIVDPYNNIQHNKDLPPPSAPPIDTIDFKVPSKGLHHHNDDHHHHHNHGHQQQMPQFYPTQRPLVQNKLPPQQQPAAIPPPLNDLPLLNHPAESQPQPFQIVDEPNSIDFSTSTEQQLNYNSAEISSAEVVSSSESIETFYSSAEQQHTYQQPNGVGAAEEVPTISSAESSETNASQEQEPQVDEIIVTGPGFFSELWSYVIAFFTKSPTVDDYQEFKRSIDEMLFSSSSSSSGSNDGADVLPSSDRPAKSLGEFRLSLMCQRGFFNSIFIIKLSFISVNI